MDSAATIFQPQEGLCHGAWCVKDPQFWGRYSNGFIPGVFFITKDGFYDIMFDFESFDLKKGDFNKELGRAFQRDLTMEEMEEIAPVVAPLLKKHMKTIEDKYNKK